MATSKKVGVEEFKDGMRNAVLKALDGYMQEMTECENAKGWRDRDLPQLLAAVDHHAYSVAVRFNAPESEEAGSAFLSVIY